MNVREKVESGRGGGRKSKREVGSDSFTRIFGPAFIFIIKSFPGSLSNFRHKFQPRRTTKKARQKLYHVFKGTDKSKKKVALIHKYRDRIQKSGQVLNDSRWVRKSRTESTT